MKVGLVEDNQVEVTVEVGAEAVDGTAAVATAGTMGVRVATTDRVEAAVAAAAVEEALRVAALRAAARVDAGAEA